MSRSLPALSRARHATRAVALLASLAAFVGGAPAVAQDRSPDAIDWGSQSAGPSRARTRGPIDSGDPGWSAKAGLGFTSDPTTFLMDFELAYTFDRWVSAGTMLQVGLEDDITLVAPTLNVGVRIPEMPGEAFDRIHPYGTVGIGFLVIEDDGEPNDKRSAGFLINVGAGVEFQLSQSVYLYSQMIFNFLPKRTQDEKFIYAWPVAGLRIAF